MKLPRIAIVTTFYAPVIGGVETHARQLAEFLVRRGMAVTVYTKRTPPGQPAVEQRNGVVVRRLPPSGDRNLRAKWLVVPAMFASLLMAARQYDVVLCIDYRGIGLAAVTAARLAGKPVALEAETPGALSGSHWRSTAQRHGLGIVAGLVGWLARWLVPIYRAADAHVCISHEFEREALACGVPPARVYYIPHGVDVERFHPVDGGERRRRRESLGLPDRRTVMFLGRLSREKGVLDLVEAWARVDVADAQLAIVGPDMPGHALDAGAEARRVVAARGLADAVRFVGPTDDPAFALGAADLFVQPSHYEAFGLSALEALASGLPVVATEVGGLPDFVRNGVNGALAPPQAPERLAQILSGLLKSPERVSRLAAGARRTAVAEFSEEIVASRFARLLEVLAAPRAS